MAKKLFIQTYGCQMNVYDSARMADVLAADGFEPVAEAADADLVILNTCHIREKAAEKVYSALGRLRQLRHDALARGRDMMIGVGGCVAQAEGEEMIRRAPVVDIVFGPQTYHRLPDMLTRARGGEQVVETDFATRPKFDALGATPPAGAVTAFLSVQEGCDKFCTFCVVPYTRGAEFSRPAAPVLAEARTLVRRGAREITLLGQNVNAYHGTAPEGDGTWSLARLIRALAEIDGLDRIRYMTSHPRDMDDELIAVHRDVPQVAPYLHLPVQSGSDRVLGAMNRNYSVTEYLRIVDRLRAARPDIALSSDFIVGFPGETDEDFEATLDLARAVDFAAAFSFAYSARPGTPAAETADQIPDEEKSARLQRLQGVLAAATRAFNAACVGRRLDVLFDKPGRHPGQAAGRSPYLQAVHVDCGDDGAARALIGTLRPTTITAASGNSLTGTVASDPAGVRRRQSSSPPMPTRSVPA